ncbi:hypothetical protein EXN66_Car015963 [Channa argus]|uniref:Uncharacterized protein n=1 Tax=Channa argus TaxID=215402 RepID=A0A6G1QDS5_CHAAH|nr:hypothetical protein EXN66_Car015963 [Channa argus]
MLPVFSCLQKLYCIFCRSTEMRWQFIDYKQDECDWCIITFIKGVPLPYHKEFVKGRGMTSSRML